MKFPRTLLAVAACSIVIAMMAACGSSSGPKTVTKIPPPPPTGNNYTTCANQQVPNWQYSQFISNYQPAMAALVSNYGSNSSIGYIRIGLGKGGEINLPQGWDDSSSGACYGGYSGKWGYTAGSASDNWNTYLQSMVQFESTLGGHPLLVSITPITDVGTEPDDFIAQVANQNGISFGNQGLEASDIANYPNCGGDWCNLFAAFRPKIAELQTLGQSCPTGTTCVNSLSSSTGPLDPLLPFATAHGANDLELYYQDWLIAFDSDYANSIGVSSTEQTAYQLAIQTAAGTGATMQVLFPPQQGDSTMCGSLTCYQAVQNYLVTGLGSAYVTGFVIDVDWSDFDLGNSANSAHASYDFSISDASISPYSGKQINLVLQNTTYGGNGCPSSGTGANGNVGSNCAMPQWMWTVLQ